VNLISDNHLKAIVSQNHGEWLVLCNPIWAWVFQFGMRNRLVLCGIGIISVRVWFVTSSSTKHFNMGEERPHLSTMKHELSQTSHLVPHQQMYSWAQNQIVHWSILSVTTRLGAISRTLTGFDTLWPIDLIANHQILVPAGSMAPVFIETLKQV